MVDNGMLILDGDLSGGGDVDVAQLATLRIKGLVGGNTTIAGTLVPAVDDETTGIFTFGKNLTLEPTATLAMELGGTTPGTDFDQLRVNDVATLGGMLELLLIDNVEFELYQQFTILDVGASLSGNFAGLPEQAKVGNFNGLDVFITYQGGDGNDVVLFTAAVPEPGTLLLGAMASIGLMLRRQFLTR
jgi:fibronectin-binding autotransporter adhesin